MLPILVSVFATLPVFKPPDDFEPEWLVPADPTFKGGANYVAINQINKKRYDGESVNFHNRYGSHKSDAFNPNCYKYNSHLYKSIRKYGWDQFKWYFRQTFKFEGLEKLSKEQREAFFKAFKASYLHPCETYWIKRFGLLNPDKGYNKQESTEGGAGHAHTEETKAKLRLLATGRRHSEETKAKLSKPVIRCEILEDYGATQKIRITRYVSGLDAQKSTGIAIQSISLCCNKKQYSAGGSLWGFSNGEDVVIGERIVHVVIGERIVARVGKKPIVRKRKRYGKET